MGTATAGSSGVPGDPGALRGAAASFGGASGHLDGLAGDLRGAAPGSWSGPASVACQAMCRVLAGNLGTGSDAFRMVALALRQLADDIEAAQEKAAAALSAAADADAAADGLALKASVTEDPAAPVALIGQLQGEATGLRMLAMAAREAAEAAALVAAGVFAQAGGMAPDPPPPPAPPAAEHGGVRGFLDDAWNTVESVPGTLKDGYDSANAFIDDRQEDMDGLVHGLTGRLPGPLEWAANNAYQWSPMSPKFSVDFAQGVGDWGVGLIEATPMLIRLSPQYGMIDPSGQREQQRQLAAGLSYAWDNPGETLKYATGWNHVENGEPGRMAGQAAPDVVLAILSGGGSVATRTASTSSKVLDLAGDASTLQRAAGGSAGLVDDVVRSGRVSENVVHDAEGRLLINGRPPDNSGIFPGLHPKTDVPFTQEGFPDFYGKPGAVHTDAPNAPDGSVKINMVGDHKDDFKAADAAAGITKQYRQQHNLTWHHLEDCQTMILVDADTHAATGHHGAVSLFRAGICK